jgi:hypothetical protein
MSVATAIEEKRTTTLIIPVSGISRRDKITYDCDENLSARCTNPPNKHAIKKALNSPVLSHTCKENKLPESKSIPSVRVSILSWKIYCGVSTKIAVHTTASIQVSNPAIYIAKNKLTKQMLIHTLYLLRKMRNNSLGTKDINQSSRNGYE